MTIDLSALLTELLPALNSASTADLVWWSANDLYQWMDEGVKRLSRVTGLFAQWFAVSGFIAPEQPLGAGVAEAIHVSWNAYSLRASTVRELEALDPAWVVATAVAPTRWTQDLGAGQIRLYPIPTGSATVERVDRIAPVPVTPFAGQYAYYYGTTGLRAPLAIGNYLYDHALGEARHIEGEPTMPEVAEACKAECMLLEQIFQRYYGGGE